MRFQIFRHLNTLRASKFPCSCSFCLVLHDGLHDGNLPASHKTQKVVGLDAHFFCCRDHLPGHSYTYKSPAKREAAAAAVDLSNATFSALEDQIEGLNEIRVTQEPCACLGLFVCIQSACKIARLVV